MQPEMDGLTAAEGHGQGRKGRASSLRRGHAHSTPDLRRNKAKRSVRAGTTQEKYKNCWVPRVARVGEAGGGQVAC